MSAAVRLSAFTLPEVQRITSHDTLELGQLGERKQAIFCVIPDSNDTSESFCQGGAWIFFILFTQILSLLLPE